MKISIIIPCYNVGQYLTRCIESVLSQTYYDFEVILIDDGSTDTTLEICKDYEKRDYRIRVFSHKNKGVSFTRNRGIKEAKGEFIMFVDGDDYIEREYIQNHVINLEKDCITISGFLNEKNEVVSKNINFKSILSNADVKCIQKNELLQLLKYDALSTPCCKLYSLKYIRKNHLFFDEKVTYQEDLLFNINYFSYFSRYKLINFFGYHYVSYDNSSTSRYHVNFDHTNQIFKQLSVFVNNQVEEDILKEFVLQTLLRKVSNIFHKNNLDTLLQKNKKISGILNSEEFLYSKDFIEKLDLNWILKKIIQREISFVISSYFCLRELLIK